MSIKSPLIEFVSKEQIPKKASAGSVRSVVTKALLELKIGQIIHVKNIRESNARTRAEHVTQVLQHHVHCRVLKDYPNEAWFWLEGSNINHCE